MKTVISIFISYLLLFATNTQANPAVERFLQASYMHGASVSIMVKDVKTGAVVYNYDADREVTPASVMKLVTTATALEILGENYRYETAIMYDGQIQDSTLNGNLYIRGSGDPTLGSEDMGPDRDKVMREWVRSIKRAGIKKITGDVIADESIFDTEGISMKWMREDLGSYYGQGCYGLSIFDNRYSLYLNTSEPNTSPVIERSDPEMSDITFRNYLTTTTANKDSFYIVGFPYSNERYIYGSIPANRSEYQLTGDIPEPALFLAQYLTNMLKDENITVTGNPTCYRILSQGKKWQKQDRRILTTTYSMPLKDLVRITNYVSNNLYADAFLKTIGLKYKTDEVLSSFDKGIHMLRKHWEEKNIELPSLWMFDGSGLAVTDKISANNLCNLLSYMATKSSVSKSYIMSIPRTGIEGTVKSTLRGSSLQGKVRFKSGTMSRVRCYAGYVTKNNKQYAVAILVNNFSCEQSQMKRGIEKLMLDLF